MAFKHLFVLHLNGLDKNEVELLGELLEVLVPASVGVPRHRLRNAHAQEARLQLDGLVVQNAALVLEQKGLDPPDRK